MRKLRKRAQKQINRHTRALNKNLLEDNLWRGRFYVHQVDANWEEFEDGSGGELRCWIEIRDKKTGLYHGFVISNYGTGWKLFEESNNFIVQDSGVWDDINAVKNDTTDWTKVKWKPVKEVF
jgi:hypothetical protein